MGGKQESMRKKLMVRSLILGIYINQVQIRIWNPTVNLVNWCTTEAAFDIPGKDTFSKVREQRKEINDRILRNTISYHRPKLQIIWVLFNFPEPQ